MAQLRQYTGEFKQSNTQVLIISFGSDYWARLWLQEAGSPFPLLLDPQRSVYRAYGLQQSLLRSWNLRTIGFYARALLSGSAWRGIQGDSSQLGGDFIVDVDGVIRLAYRSHYPTDRPSVRELLSVLRQLKAKSSEQELSPPVLSHKGTLVTPGTTL